MATTRPLGAGHPATTRRSDEPDGRTGRPDHPRAASVAAGSTCDRRGTRNPPSPARVHHHGTGSASAASATAPRGPAAPPASGPDGSQSSSSALSPCALSPCGGRSWTAADVRRYRRRTAQLQAAVVLALLLGVVCSMLTGA